MNVEVIFKPIPWNDYVSECLTYLVIMGQVHLIVFVVGCLILVAVPRKKPGILRRRIGHFGLFLALFLIVGPGQWVLGLFDL